MEETYRRREFVDAIIQGAKERWLNVSELEYLLHPETTPLTISRHAPHYPPPSGTLYLYDRGFTRNYKDDGYIWIKKRNSSKVREDHVKLRVNGKYRVAGCYVHCMTNTTLHRRAYHLLDPDTGVTASPMPIQHRSSGGNNYGNTGENSSVDHSLVLVHYLDTRVAALNGVQNKAKKVEESAFGGGRRGIMQTNYIRDAEFSQESVNEARGPDANVERTMVNHYQHHQKVVNNQVCQYNQQLQYPQYDNGRTNTMYYGEQRNFSQPYQHNRPPPVPTVSAATVHNVLPVPRGHQRHPHHRKKHSLDLSIETVSSCHLPAKSFDDKDTEMLWSLIMEDSYGSLDAMIGSRANIPKKEEEKRDEYVKVYNCGGKNLSNERTAVSAATTTSPAHSSAQSMDDESFGILWSMVMDEGSENLCAMVVE